MSSLPAAVRNALVAIAGLVLLAIASFALVRTVRAGEVLPGVTIAGSDISLGGMTPQEVEQKAEELELTLRSDPVPVRVNGSNTELIPETIGFEIDEQEVASTAMATGRKGGIPEQFRWWIGNLFSGVEIDTAADIDEQALETLLQAWDAEFVGDPAFAGAVEIEGNLPVAAYPSTGRQIDRAAAVVPLLEAISFESARPAVLGVGTQVPDLVPADVDEAVRVAELWLSGPVTLTAAQGEQSITFSVAQMASALVSTATDDAIELSFDPEAIGPILAANRENIESAPVDAQLVVEDIEVSIVPGRNGTLIDPVATAANLAEAAESSSRRGILPFEEGAPPDVTTQDLEELGITHLVSSFTTYHDCCQNRVTNIHLFADAVDGTFLAPGEELDLNELVGQRTRDKGYLEDGTIVRGELVKTVGGGVSQFATTIYNAVFWGGFEDITHRPHSFYFSRYPEGIEATISWPLPDLIFRNDSDAGLLVKTEYGDNQITVKLYGDNDGRVLVGAHRSGNTEIDVVREGGPDARRVSGSVSGRYGYTDPSTEYRANPSLDVDQQVRVQSPRQGWSVTVTRTIEQGSDVTEQEWVVRYLAQREILEVHPCKVPNASEECPEPTTTTTLPEDSTTTTTEGN